MNKHIVFLALVTLCSSFLWADSSVKFKVVNSTRQKGTVKVYKQTDISPSAVPELLDSKQIDSTGTGSIVEFRFTKKIKDGTYLSVYAELDNGGRTESIYKRVEDDIEYDWTPELKLPAAKTFRKNTALDDIKSEMEYTPSLFRIRQRFSLADLFNGYFGGLIIYKESPSNDTVKIEKTIDPIQLGTRIDPKLGNHTSKKTSILSKGAGVNAGLSIPLIAGFKLDWSSSDLYKLDIQFRNAGPILWTRTAGMEPVEELFKKLSKSTLWDIGYRFNKDTTLKMAQLNNAYVFEAISFVVQEFKKINSSSTINASTFVTAQGNYELSSEESTSDVFGSSMIGAWWNNDYTPMLNYAKKAYLEEEAKTIATVSLDTAKTIYESIKTTNPDLPDFKDKKQAKSALEDLKSQIKVDEFKIRKEDNYRWK